MRADLKANTNPLGRLPSSPQRVCQLSAEMRCVWGPEQPISPVLSAWRAGAQGEQVAALRPAGRCAGPLGPFGVSFRRERCDRDFVLRPAATGTSSLSSLASPRTSVMVAHQTAGASAPHIHVGVQHEHVHDPDDG